MKNLPTDQPMNRQGHRGITLLIGKRESERTTELPYARWVSWCSSPWSCPGAAPWSGTLAYKHFFLYFTIMTESCTLPYPSHCRDCLALSRFSSFICFCQAADIKSTRLSNFKDKKSISVNAVNSDQSIYKTTSLLTPSLPPFRSVTSVTRSTSSGLWTSFTRKGR